jgi:uncharacterized iron-regulated membrane protein
LNVTEMEQAADIRPWPDYRAVWRWHFYAGLFCIPFLIVLSITGAIYLFKPQVESWIDRPYDSLEIEGRAHGADDQVRAALSAIPGSTFHSYEMPQDDHAAARVIVRHEGKATRAYVHPVTLRVLKVVGEDDRFMKVLFRIHGELLLGNRGSALVELAASWAIIMIVTGLYLWWPRGAKGLGGVVYPRLGRSSRMFWRDLHGVTGVWISGLALFLLLSGLPWAKFWGDYLKTVRSLGGTAVGRQDWTNGRSTPLDPAMAGESGEHGGHRSGAGGGGGRGRGDRPIDLAALDRIVAAVLPLRLPPPVVIAPPGRGSTEWSAKSMTANRPLRVDLTVDGATGKIGNRQDFRDRHVIDRIVGVGIAAHEGQLFGWPNQLLGLITAAGLILLSVSSVVLWWRRRERGVLGAPKIAVSPRFSAGLLVIVGIFGLYLPMFGASLITVKLIEKGVLVRIPKVRDWLGLSGSGTDSSVANSTVSLL